jgi:hypothetical protein
MAEWLHQSAPWMLAVTLTLRRRDQMGRPISERILFDTARHFLILLNVACFGSRKARRGHSVQVAVSFGWGAYRDNPHLHFSFTVPVHLTLDQLVSFVEEASRRTYWIDRHRDIQPYRDRGWMEYMVDHGSDNVILELLRPSQSLCGTGV